MPIFGSGRTYDTGPASFCNGYYNDNDTPDNPSDITCARCLNHMLQHNMLAGSITGDASTCGNFGTSTKRACQGQTMSLSCVRGSIDLSGSDATYGRMDSAYCPAVPKDPNTGTDLFASATADCSDDDTGNVQQMVEDLCQGKQLCSISVTDAALGTDAGCATTYKYLELSYQCV